MSNLTWESMLQRSQEASVLFGVRPVHLYLWPSHNAAASACPRCPAFLQLLIFACRRLRPSCRQTSVMRSCLSPEDCASFGCISTIFHIIFDMIIAQFFLFFILWSFHESYDQNISVSANSLSDLNMVPNNLHCWPDFEAFIIFFFFSTKSEAERVLEYYTIHILVSVAFMVGLEFRRWRWNSVQV